MEWYYVVCLNGNFFYRFSKHTIGMSMRCVNEGGNTGVIKLHDLAAHEIYCNRIPVIATLVGGIPDVIIWTDSDSL